jgi:hypothetical protein
MTRASRSLLLALTAAFLGTGSINTAHAAVTRAEVEEAIRGGIRYLKDQQRQDGTWPDINGEHRNGVTALATLALLTAGEPVTEPHVSRALAALDRFDAAALGSVYSVSLQTMAFAQADPARYRVQIARNVYWLERAQIKPTDGNPTWPGGWSYRDNRAQMADNSNSQYALLALQAASEAGIPVKPEVWALARQYWERGQQRGGIDDGGWNYHPGDRGPARASMSCAGISSLVITGLKRFESQEVLVDGPNGAVIRNCGKGGANLDLQRGVNWLASNFRVSENYGNGATWKLYYLYGLERVGRLAGLRYIGDHDWYFEGAEHLIHDPNRDPLQGKWVGNGAGENDPVVATSFVLLFLAKGRSPVLINKLRHGPRADWNNDRDDCRNLTGIVSRDWKHLVTWQFVDPEDASLEEMLQAPIAFFNGHEPPEFGPEGKKKLRQYVEQGGLIFADACCDSPAFDEGFRALMKEVFPEPEYDLHPLAEDHAVWRAKYPLTPDVHPLWGIEHGCRTVVIYTPKDLSCFWNQLELQPDHPAVIKASHVGMNVVDYATGRELPADKLAPREITTIPTEAPKRGALHIAKLRHAGEWNLAPMAIPNLMSFLRQQAELKFDVVINHRELTTPQDPNLVYYPMVYLHGRASFSFGEQDLAAIRRHLDPGRGLLFSDAACGSPAFDAAFRKFAAELYPDHPLEPIPPDDELYTKQSGFDLSDVQFSRSAGGGTGRPQLEGIRLNGRWAVIYSKFDIGCALERASSLECKGYTHESALRIASNVVIYATLP